MKAILLCYKAALMLLLCLIVTSAKSQGISGPTQVDSEVAYKYTAPFGTSYYWSASGGDVQGPNTDPLVFIKWRNGVTTGRVYLEVTRTTSRGEETLYYFLDVNVKVTAPIAGSAQKSVGGAACKGTMVTLTYIGSSGISSVAWQRRRLDTSDPWVTINTNSNATGSFSYAYSLQESSELQAVATPSNGAAPFVSNAGAVYVTTVVAGSTPTSHSICMGATATLTYSGSQGISSVNYEWRRVVWDEIKQREIESWLSLGSSTNAGNNFAVSVANVQEYKEIRARATSSCGDIFISNSELVPTTSAGGSASTTSASTVCTGSPVHLRYSGHNITSVVWQRRIAGSSNNWADIGNGNSSSYYFEYTYSGILESSEFRAVAQGRCGGPYYSNAVTINVGTPLIVGQVYGSQNVQPGENGGQIYLTDYNGYVQRWMKSEDRGNTWSAIANSGNDILNYTNVAVTTYYKAVVDGGACGGLQESNYAVISVDPLNWVQNKVFNEQGQVVSESRSYFDGAGKAMQSLTRDMQTGHLLASQPLYDRYGNPAGQTLAAPVGDGAFRYVENFITADGGKPYSYTHFDKGKLNEAGQTITNPVAVDSHIPNTLGWYFSQNNNLEPMVGETAYPYSRTELYSDGSGEAKRAAGQGDELRLGKGHEATSGTFPVISELDNYLALRAKFGTSIGGSPASLQYKAVQQVGIDQNGQWGLSISDPEGNVLMSAKPGDWFTQANSVTLTENQQYHLFYLLQTTSVGVTGGAYEMVNTVTEQAAAAGSLQPGFYKVIAKGTGSVTISYSNSYGDISYNFYNQLGQLKASVAPNGVQKLLAHPAGYVTVADFPFTSHYEYDLLGRLIALTETDAGRTEYVYRRDGKIRFSQNAEQRRKDGGRTERYSYSHYDTYGRPVESGEFDTKGTGTPFASARASESILEAIIVGTETSGGISGGECKDVINMVYDIPQNTGDPGYAQEFIRGAVAMVSNANGKTFYSYDSQGRLTWTLQDIVGLGRKTVDYTYDMLGNVLTVCFQKGNAAERFTHYYAYDRNGRLAKVETNRAKPEEGVARDLQATYYYYLHGPLKRVELADKLQGIDYVYTVQGWLKSMNHADVARDPGKDGSGNGFAKDAFGMTLEYFSGDYVRSGSNIASLSKIESTYAPQYNGNIRAMAWQTQAGTTNTAKMYAYQYDPKYQMLASHWGGPNYNTSNFDRNSNNINSEYGLSYDPNGNIKSLVRTNASGAIVDNFTYSLLGNTNKLAQVKNGTNTYGNYAYDALGQMDYENSTDGGARQLTYDVYGKLTGYYTIETITAPRVKFHYDAIGQRVRKDTYVNGAISYSTFYVRDASGNELAVYDDNNATKEKKLTEVPVYASNRIGSLNAVAGTYSYQLSDHLGNVRAVISRIKLSSGLADVRYYSDYYAFGEELGSGGSDKPRQGYQGQFAEKDQETGWNSFELRMYNSKVGRWMSSDPAKQYWSPYVGMGNNPVSGIDPDGAKKVHYNADGSWSHTSHNNFFHNLAYGNQKYVADQWGGFSKASDSYFWNVNQQSYKNSPKYWGGEIGLREQNLFGQFYEYLGEQEPAIEFTGKFIYGFVDDFYVSLMQTGKNRMHLNNTGVLPQEIADAGVNTLITFSPFTNVGLPSKTLNASQYNKAFAGTGLNSRQKGMVKLLNSTIKFYNKALMDIVPFFNGKALYDTYNKTMNE